MLIPIIPDMVLYRPLSALLAAPTRSPAGPRVVMVLAMVQPMTPADIARAAYRAVADPARIPAAVVMDTSVAPVIAAAVAGVQARMPAVIAVAV